jgi:hypothetical protein
MGRFIASLLFLFLLASPSFADVGSSELSFEVDVDPEGQYQEGGFIHGSLLLKAMKNVKKPVRLRISLSLPCKGGEFSEEIELKGRKEGVVRIPIKVPSDSTEVYAIPISIKANGIDYLSNEVRVARTTGWWVIGPFPGGRAESHAREFPPERKVDLKAKISTKEGVSISWKPFPADAIDENGYHDLNKALGFTEYATAYAFATIWSDAERKGRLLLGSDDSVKVWHNGRLIHEKNVHRSSAPGQDVVDVNIVKGKNSFLLKICNDDGWWGFHFALDDGFGNPIPGLRYETRIERVYVKDPVLRLRSVSRTDAILTWNTDLMVPAKIYVVEASRGRRLVWGSEPKENMVWPAPGSKPKAFSDRTLNSSRGFKIGGLEPGKRYLVWVDPAVKDGRSEKLAFYTAPPPGKTMFLRLKVVALISTNATQKRYEGLEGAAIPAPEEEIARIKREIEGARMFYWINSGMRLAIDVDYIVDNAFHSLPNDNPYGFGFTEGDDAYLKDLLRSVGKSIEEYDGRVFITLEKLWDERNKRWFYPASGGGTIGPEGEPGMGKSAWKGGSDNGWLFCHEFHHQIDALYHYSMGPEYLFCHFQPWDDTAHRHGEHWDGNAWILWEWAGYVTRSHQKRPFLNPDLWFRYFINRWGEVFISDDEDEDGFPDDDPRVPLDERRFGSSGKLADTDGDGLSDLMEAMACEWVDYGLGEIWAGDERSHRCDPRNPDTDGDGIRDGDDPYPLYPIDPEVRKGQMKREPFVRMKDMAYEADFWIGWDDQALSIAMRARDIPREVKIMLDLDDDGWFVGGDNYLIRVGPGGGSFEFHNCSVPGKWPFFDPSRIKEGDISFEQRVGDSGYEMLVRIRRNPENGLELREGEEIGLLLAVEPRGGTGRKGKEGMLTVFEPHTFVSLRLVGP